MEQNMNILDFELTADDMTEIARLDTKGTLFFSHNDPGLVKMLLDVKI